MRISQPIADAVASVAGDVTVGIVMQALCMS